MVIVITKKENISGFNTLPLKSSFHNSLLFISARWYGCLDHLQVERGIIGHEFTSDSQWHPECCSLSPDSL